MNDVELLFCTYAGHPEIGNLVELARDERRPREMCERAIEQLVSLCKRELAASNERWTPHYDRALRFIIDNRAVLYAGERHYSEDGAPYDASYWGFIQSMFATHASFVGLFNSTIARGGRMLSDAFDLVSISTSEARSWLRLVPDQAALVEQLHAAARRCMENMEWAETTVIRSDYAFVKAVAEADSIDDMYLSHAPLELFVELGNPFLPKTRPESP